MTVAAAVDAATFEEHRPLLFGVAYRMLGSAAAAEDVVQETYLRALQARAGEVRSARAYLVTIATRLCLDELKSARAQRETYVGTWLPEPLPTGDGHVLSPEAAVAERESISLAFLVLLERLTPVERAVFLLREVFAFEYAEIAGIVGRSEAACRQIFHRARERVRGGEQRQPVSPAEHREITMRFVQAAGGGSLAALIALLSESVIAWSDGGGRVASAINPIYGPSRVARFVIGISRKCIRAGELTGIEFADVNGEPGIIWRDRRGRPTSVSVLEVTAGKVVAVRSVRNPGKLRPFREARGPVFAVEHMAGSV
ncbi:MAG: RNA polymerase sigma-70 factor [Dehalococcoidia bacterium]|nr:RNA polymerase sigma-70 factor [Dehalococcoidia bacterium]